MSEITGPTTLTVGPFAGWSTWSQGADPFETAIGPFCYRTEADGLVAAFLPRREHLNGGGTVHGGALMSFADFSLFAIAHHALRGAHAVTLTCNCEFISAARDGEVVEARGEVLRDTRTLVFVRGVAVQGGRAIMAYSGTLKKLGLAP